MTSRLPDGEGLRALPFEWIDAVPGNRPSACQPTSARRRHRCTAHSGRGSQIYTVCIP
jgi:hypothetical protein